MRIAVVGAGISGLACAWLLGKQHEVVVFEGEGWIGGHTHTVEVDDPVGPQSVDTGFIVYNERNYPLFTRFLNHLGVATQPTRMSFSVRDDHADLEYNGTSPNGLFAQRRNLLRPWFWKLLTDISHFNCVAREALKHQTLDDTQTVGDFVQQHRFSRQLLSHYLAPMGAAIWSVPIAQFEQFPLMFVLEFMHNHALLQVGGRPRWRVIRGGSSQYVNQLLKDFPGMLRTETPVREVARNSGRIQVRTESEDEAFDEIVMACHADQTLALLAEPLTEEAETLRSFPYQRNQICLHTDTGVMPKRKRAWAAWNATLSGAAEATEPFKVSYHMNNLQGLAAERDYMVSLNLGPEIPRPDTRLLEIEYQHPIYTSERKQAQENHHQLIRNNGISCCGAYWGSGFHEDGLRSGVKVAAAFGCEPPW